MSIPRLFDPTQAMENEAESGCRFPDLAPQSAYRYGCRCGRCRAERARWTKERMKRGPLPCAAPGCTDLRRSVQGARYCEEHATSLRYTPTGRRKTIECAVCRAGAYVWRGTPYPICNSCRKRLVVVRLASKHGVSLPTLLDWVERSSCDLCGRHIYLGANGGKESFAIDHDHKHCPGAFGCAACVRGLLCRTCNLSLGHVESLASRFGWSSVQQYIESRR